MQHFTAGNSASEALWGMLAEFQGELSLLTRYQGRRLAANANLPAVRTGVGLTQPILAAETKNES